MILNQSMIYFLSNMKKWLLYGSFLVLFSSFLFSQNINLDESASYLSGLGVSENSLLYERSRTSYYLNYKKKMDAGWININRVSLSKIPHWRNREINEKFRTVFYPFGGPDLLNALVFFPEAEYYILIGLEAPGFIPKPVELSRSSDQRGLNLVHSSMNEILGHNFFHTKIMAKKIARHSYNGIIGIMMIMAKREGYNIESVDIFSSHQEKSWKGFHMKFLKGNLRKNLIYIQANVNDQYFADNRILHEILNKYHPDITMLKAASYLMFLPSFDDIRSYILSQSRFIIQDASGVPFHYFQSDWEMNLYGKYVQPIPLFAKRCQPDLKLAVTKKSKGKLPFYYGYLSPRYNQTFVMVAKKKNQATQPKYDRSTGKGMNTWCYKGKLIKNQN